MSDLSHAESNALVCAIESLIPSNPSQNQTRGSVTRVETDGTVWVQFVGAAADTPCTRVAASAKPGDNVSVSIVNGRGVVTGNFSNPATDDSVAKTALGNAASALQAADIANTSARQAASDARLANISAASAKTSAKEAAVSAGEAKESADSAIEDAKSAMSSAVAALNQLGTIEDVSGTLAWIRDHEVYIPATQWTSGSIYYEYIDGKYEQVQNPVEDNLSSYYVYDHKATMAGFVQQHLTVTSRGLFITKSEPIKYTPGDKGYYKFVKATKWDENQTYYYHKDTIIYPQSDEYVSGNAVYEEVENPQEQYLSSYYIREEENAGNIHPTGSGYMLLTDNAIEIYDCYGKLIARYGDGIELAHDYLGKPAVTINNKTIHIAEAELTGGLSINNWMWLQRDNENISFKWREK